MAIEETTVEEENLHVLGPPRAQAMHTPALTHSHLEGLIVASLLFPLLCASVLGLDPISEAGTQLVRWTSTQRDVGVHPTPPPISFSFLSVHIEIEPRTQ